MSLRGPFPFSANLVASLSFLLLFQRFFALFTALCMSLTCALSRDALACSRAQIPSYMSQHMNFEIFNLNTRRGFYVTPDACY